MKRTMLKTALDRGGDGGPPGRLLRQPPRGAHHGARPRRRHHRLVLVRQLRRPVEDDDGAVGRSPARAVQRAQLLPVRSRNPLRDEDRQQPRRRGGPHAAVPVPDRAAPPGRVHGLRRQPRGHSAHHGARRPRLRGPGHRQSYSGGREGQPAPRPHGRPQALRRAHQRRARAPCPTTRRSTTRASTTWASASRCLPAPPTTPSTSTWAPRSTRSTSARPPAAACCRRPTTPTTR